MRGHKCQRLFYLEVSDYDENESVEQDHDNRESDVPPLISLHAITGIRTEATMQLRISIGNEELTALPDSGSTHNFISSAATQRISLNFHTSHGAKVIVANGDRVACRGLAKHVAVCIADTSFTLCCYDIPLDCYDVILGVSWLRTLGPILWDFDDLCMDFWHQG